MSAGRWGLLEPPEPWLPESALAEAELVLVPALAVDRRGVRLGRGRGFYDRSLDGRDPQARLIAMVRDVEFVDELPADPHDVPMTHVITPRRGVMRAGTDGTRRGMRRLHVAVLALRHGRVLIRLDHHPEVLCADL